MSGFRRWPWLAFLAAAAAGCSSSAGVPAANFRGPVAVVAFQGKTHRYPGLVVPYLAVASSHGDELRLFDPATDGVVVSPGFAFPLSIPTLAGPLRLAAASMSDGQPDVLAVSGPGSTVELVSTWDDGTGGVGNRVVQSIDLAAVAGPGKSILSMVGAPVPGTPAGTPLVAPPVVGKARILVGFSGGTLVAMEFVRGAGGSVAYQGAAAHALGFDPIELASSPDNFHVYCASPDVITDSASKSVLGVAEVDTIAWTVRGLDAKAPTMLVAAASVGQRLAADPEQFAAPAIRVYAALDPSACGVDRASSCGIAVLDPVTGQLAPDPASGAQTNPTLPGAVPPQAYMTPLLVPGIATALATAKPPVTGGQQSTSSASTPGAVAQPLMLLAPESGQRWTTAAAAAGSGIGPLYILDLGRYSNPDAVSLLRTDTRTRARDAVSVNPAGSAATAPILGLWQDHPGFPPAGGAPGVPFLATTPADLAAAVVVAPGFTRAEIWAVSWQGSLPGLSARPAVVGSQVAGQFYLAFQQVVSGQPSAWVRLDDPRLGIHVGDIVQIGGGPCAGLAAEATVADILPPTPALYPGGALLLGSVPACVAGLPAGSAQEAVGTVRATGLLLTGVSTGYAGRPTLETRYNLAWQPEDPLLAACAFFSPTSPQPPAFCDAACRSSCEALILARRARRFYYPSEPACSAGTPCYEGFPEMIDPLGTGPALGFRVGLNPGQTLVRDAYVTFATQDGVVPMSRAPSVTSVPTAVTSLDKSQLPGGSDLGTVFYATYLGDALLEAPPGVAAGSAKTFR